MEIKAKLKKYGNTVVIRFNKELVELLAKERMSTGDWVNIKITRIPQEDSKRQRGFFKNEK